MDRSIKLYNILLGQNFTKEEAETVISETDWIDIPDPAAGGCIRITATVKKTKRGVRKTAFLTI